MDTADINDGEWHDRRRRALVATTALGGTGAVVTAYPFIQTLRPSERARAFGAPVEVSLSPIRAGELVTVTWRGNPVWILRRTRQMLDSLAEGQVALSDPESLKSDQPTYAQNAHRSVNPEYFIAIALCTHLGCIPSFRPDPRDTSISPDWPGGFFCPCHGSKFDLAGRVYKNVPAPTNLTIPPYRIESQMQVIIG